MSSADALGALIVLLCLGGSMFFSGSETAIMSLGEHQARKWLEEGGREAKIVAQWVNRPVRVLSTILVGNNVVNTLLGSVITAITIRHLQGGEYGDWAVPVAVFGTTVLLLMFGEIMPKAVGRLYSQRLALPALSVLNVVSKVLAPAVWTFAKATNFLLSKAAPPPEGGKRVTAEDLAYLVKVGAREGSILPEQAELLRGIFRFDDKIVRHIMVPQDHVTAIDRGWDVDRVIQVAMDSGHSRLPVYEGDLDHIKGVLHIKTLVGRQEHGREALEQAIRPPLFVSESVHISDLLQRFKEERVHLGIVVDDGGHTVGVVTLEDVLEQIVGKIFDESDDAPNIISDTLGVKYLDGTASITLVEETFGVEFEEFDGVDSVGDFLTQLAGQIPIAGSVVVYESLRFKVLAANPRRVIRVSVERVDLDEPED
jgi:CBS domain containing-hemolysin-like protein